MDWIDLFTGSEGTLGIVTEAELQLLPAPADVLAGIVFLISDGAALDVVDAWRRIPGLRMIEYFDANSLDFLRPHYPEILGRAAAAFSSSRKPAMLISGPITRLKTVGSPRAIGIANVSGVSAMRCRN